MKILPTFEFPNEQDVLIAEQFICADVPAGQIYTDEQRREIQRLSRQIMMKRKTVQ